MKSSSPKKLSSERNKLLKTVVSVTEVPLIVLGFIWLGLLILELLNTTSMLLETLGVVIWIIFILDFILKFTIATSKTQFLRRNILTIISLIVPAFRLLRLFRILRLLRLSRSLRLVKIVGSFNRGMRSLAYTMKKRALGYVLLLSVIVVFIGSAGLYAFEKDVNQGFQNYSSSIWWTAMLITGMGTENWPLSTEGRIVCFLIAVYGFAVFGYITASIATFFIGRDADDKLTEENKNKEAEILQELQLLRKELHDLKQK